ncbi:unnamed protein product [Paramecium primaurelia]|uniref:Uncharacterized protein n=1 Tax=Paramecium primaurelia TaxID=5886 RepID=A0A8S1QGF8_PARPR|nr:unnamed protein product [Paramecium primaurelia]
MTTKEEFEKYQESLEGDSNVQDDQSYSQNKSVQTYLKPEVVGPSVLIEKAQTSYEFNDERYDLYSESREIFSKPNDSNSQYQDQEQKSEELYESNFVYQDKKYESLELQQLNNYQYQNQLSNGTIERQKKLSENDHSLILVDKLDIIQNKDRLNESVDMLLTIILQVKEKFQEEIKVQEKKDYYMNKLQKFSQKKIMKKFKIKQFKDNQYNFISQYLIRQENEESLKILLSCFIEYTFQWINLLDFKQEGKSQTFKEIQEFLKQEIIEQTTIKLGIQNYFQNKTYQKFDFIEFVINLLKIYQELKNLQTQELIIYQQQQEIYLQQLDAYQQQLFDFLKKISEMKLNRYKQKMNINFSLKTFKKLISCDAKPEVLNAIKAAKRKPKQFLNELILNDEEIKDFQEAIEKLLKKAKKL